MEIIDKISDFQTILDCVDEMKKIAKVKISDSNIKIRYMADLMYRYADRIETLHKLSNRNN